MSRSRRGRREYFTDGKTREFMALLDASVRFYVDDVFSGVIDSNDNGFASLSLDISEGSHNWYAFAYKTGYMNATSSSYSFTYSVPEPEPETTSGIPGFPFESILLSARVANWYINFH